MATSSDTQQVMDPAVSKKTRDLLGRVIRKPILTDKLLAKPPFRFLHDVIVSVINTTGFMTGLYTNHEQNSENCKDRDSKTAFLQKAIDIVALANVQAPSVKVARVIAGQDPDKTNDFLQALALAVQKKDQNTDLVKRVLESRSRKSDASKADASALDKKNSNQKQGASDTGKSNESKPKKSSVHDDKDSPTKTSKTADKTGGGSHAKLSPSKQTKPSGTELTDSTTSAYRSTKKEVGTSGSKHAPATQKPSQLEAAAPQSPKRISQDSSVNVAADTGSPRKSKDSKTSVHVDTLSKPHKSRAGSQEPSSKKGKEGKPVVEPAKAKGRSGMSESPKRAVGSKTSGLLPDSPKKATSGSKTNVPESSGRLKDSGRAAVSDNKGENSSHRKLLKESKSDLADVKSSKKLLPISKSDLADVSPRIHERVSGKLGDASKAEETVEKLELSAAEQQLESIREAGSERQDGGSQQRTDDRSDVDSGLAQEREVGRPRDLSVEQKDASRLDDKSEISSSDAESARKKSHRSSRSKGSRLTDDGLTALNEAPADEEKFAAMSTTERMQAAKAFDAAAAAADGEKLHSSAKHEATGDKDSSKQANKMEAIGQDDARKSRHKTSKTPHERDDIEESGHHRQSHKKELAEEEISRSSDFYDVDVQNEKLPTKDEIRPKHSIAREESKTRLVAATDEFRIPPVHQRHNIADEEVPVRQQSSRHQLANTSKNEKPMLREDTKSKVYNEPKSELQTEETPVQPFDEHFVYPAENVEELSAEQYKLSMEMQQAAIMAPIEETEAEQRKLFIEQHQLHAEGVKTLRPKSSVKHLPVDKDCNSATVRRQSKPLPDANEQVMGHPLTPVPFAHPSQHAMVPTGGDQKLKPMKATAAAVMTAGDKESFESNRNTNIRRDDQMFVDTVITGNQEAADDDRPKGRKTIRPSSARPLQRVKADASGEAEDAQTLALQSVPNVIVDNDRDPEEADETFVLKEDDVSTPGTGMSPRSLIASLKTLEDYVDNDDAEDPQQHGGLVRKILETKKGLEVTNKGRTEIDRTEAEQADSAGRKKEREMVQKEVSRLRGTIQSLTSNVVPLVKILDFIQEDVDAMQKELEMWRHETQENTIALQREQSLTESVLEPLQSQLAELERQIADQVEANAAVKASLMSNDDKIARLINSIRA